ncbi:Gaa1-domain-containing protein [Epithele typhae]|uniref:Gaa1-domain-containing protein n=1 Tax=Epithele typhae TaxID=378194 RepID=UPI00200842C3|nr:Gaa1-domain-containing protein [Epithele typhae]KAH9946130.1 Gaa1-domain-containing protein [Epithele typhae]
MPPVIVKTIVSRIRARLRGNGDPNATRILRRRALGRNVWRLSPFVQVTLFAVGYLWMLAIPAPQLGQRTYIDENALQPGQVNTYWNWADVFRADRILEDLEALRDRNATSQEIAQYSVDQFEKAGIPARTQHYSFDTLSGSTNGTNAYAVLRPPRAPGTEAIVVSASWMSRTGEGDGTLNLRGVSTVLSLAHYLKKQSHWAKDLVFVISDGYLDGMQAWVTTYHGAEQSNMYAEPLMLSSGVIWTAINVDYPGHSFSHLGIFFEGLNGRLPNQDLMNAVSLITRHTGGVPALVYDHKDKDPKDMGDANALLPSWLPGAIKENSDVREYATRARNVIRHMKWQARGSASGVHGLFHQFRIDAITVFAIPAPGPHGFHALGRILESSLRTMNNLLERLHASFFFFLYVNSGTFMKIGMYLPSAVLVGTAMLFTGLRTWVYAGWKIAPSTEFNDEKKTSTQDNVKWNIRSRPVLSAVTVMLTTHLFGVVLFYLVSNGLAPNIVLFVLSSTIPTVALQLVPRPPAEYAPLWIVLKAFNVCLTSAVISITSLLNFSLAATLAVLMGIPMSTTHPLPSLPLRIARYALHTVLALGWLVFFPEETASALRNWDLLRVWFAPFVCIVYAPLVLQSALVCLLPP